MFRTPEFPNIFACFIGIGAQLFVSFYGMLVFTTIFFSSHYMLRPYILTIALVALAFLGWVNGFVTARVLKFFGSIDWCFSAFIAAAMFPIWLILTAGFIDVIEWIEGSSSFVPFLTLFFYCCCWLALCIPLSFHGAYVGFGLKQTKKVCKVNPVRRIIPP